MPLRELLIVALLLTGGCARTLMPTPIAATEGLIDPFQYTSAEHRGIEAPIFVASARTVSGNPDPAKYYTNDRGTEVHLGRASVAIGSGMAWDELVNESRAEHRKHNPPVVVTKYEAFGALWTTAWPPDMRFARDWDAPGVDRNPAERFASEIDARLKASRKQQITVYVHGFNTLFESNLATAAEFWHYMARDEVVISFDWPSKGSLFSYQVDKANAELAIRQFRKLLEFLAANTQASRINIMAHSAGNPVVVEALRQLSLMHYDKDDADVKRITKIGRVVLAAPDMDLDAALSASVDGASRVAERVALYASAEDRALGFSGTIFGQTRLGNSIGKLSDAKRQAVIDNDAQWIDVAPAQRRYPDFLGHSYHYANPWVNSDIMLFLRLGATPQERGLVRDPKTGFLTFPEDYRERLPQIVKQMKPKFSR